MAPAYTAKHEMMNGWETLSAAIPRGEAEAIAELAGVSADMVRRWQVQYTNEEGYGRRSPLDHALRLVNALYARNPEGAEMVVDRILSEIAWLRKKHGAMRQPSAAEMEIELRQISRATALMADAIVEKK